jgi:peroxiredoxin Q/BCP
MTLYRNQLSKGVSMVALILSLFISGSGASALQKGDIVDPKLSAKNQDGQSVTLGKFRKQFVVLYFYPKDDTPGCTTEAQNFQAELGKLKNLNAVVLGVSRQDEESHQKFIAKNALKFDLLVDRDGKFGEAFGVGSIPVVGLTKRETVLIGPDGRLIRIYENVNPKEHAKEVIKDIESASKKI